MDKNTAKRIAENTAKQIRGEKPMANPCDVAPAVADQFALTGDTRAAFIATFEQTWVAATLAPIRASSDFTEWSDEDLRVELRDSYGDITDRGVSWIFKVRAEMTTRGLL